MEGDDLGLRAHRGRAAVSSLVASQPSVGTNKQSIVVNAAVGAESRAGGTQSRVGRDEPLEECVSSLPSGKNYLEMLVACMKSRKRE